MQFATRRHDLRKVQSREMAEHRGEREGEYSLFTKFTLREPAFEGTLKFVARADNERIIGSTCRESSCCRETMKLLFNSDII